MLSTKTKRSRPLGLGGAVAVGLLLGGCAEAAPRASVTPTVKAADSASSRLIVSTEKGVVVLDAVAGETLSELDAGASPRLQPASDGRHVYATEASSGTTRVVDSGLGEEPHGDHSHVVAKAPSLLEAELRHRKPNHVVAHAGRVAVFDDETGGADLYDERELFSGDGSAPVALRGDGPHHGLAIPLSSATLLTLPGDAVAGSVVRLADDGTRDGEPAVCPGLHGSAILADSVVFGCRTGLLVVDETGASSLIPYPSTHGRTGSFAQPKDRGAAHVLGQFGDADSTRALVFDTATGGSREIELGSAYRSMVDLGDGRAAVSLTDGRVAFVDLARGEVDRSVEAIEPWTPPTGHAGTAPALAAAGSEVFLTDPAGKRVLAIDTRIDHVRAFPVEAAPAAIVAIPGLYYQ